MLLLYRLVTDLLGPVVPLLLAVRQRRGKEDPERRPERLGRSRIARPSGSLIWVHAASVGEVMSARVLVSRLLDAVPQVNILVTSGTVTSADLLAGKLPDRVFHQFVPLDRAPYATRFLDHWRPDLVLWLESELWPNLLQAIRRRTIPAVLVNARMSARSCRRWSRLPRTARHLLGSFARVLPANTEAAERFATLGAAHIGPVGNLKAAAAPLEAPQAALSALRAAVGARPVWVAASTHRGEEAVCLEAHRAVAAQHRDLLTIVAPRHPDRGGEIAELARRRGLAVAVRSRGALPRVDTDVYVADTMGELGLMFRIAPVALIGGSLVPHGGHNPLEAAQLGSAVLFGPHMTNFPDSATPLREAGAATVVADAAGLAAAVTELLTDPARRAQMTTAASGVAATQCGVVDGVLAAVMPLLPAPTAGDTTTA